MPNPLNGITDAMLMDLGINPADALKFKLLFAKAAGNPAQTVNLATFAAANATTDDRVSTTIASLVRSDAVRASYGVFTINWATAPTPSTTAAQLQADWNSKVLDDPTYYVYQMLALTKPAASLTQQVDPATFAAPPWNLPTPILIAEVQRLAGRRPTTANPSLTAPFTADFANVGLTWMTPNLGNAA